ncbi:serine threonine protein partial : Serine/threonine protein kinase domain protein OS=Rhodopirellula sp. SWK7 GN=RRSWK_02781 PE=4 SV=1: Pkinase: NPCBM [Gemmataceae bacterium]|nr:serine threonine protein partial : Serine/threonine protein kinase domain protein OS=Rhodopirellula sp. SWK7 GN=RRSWK_02781 PE=4 SV=1: Pkinase: NPCBM [Gemmataceae bacterium]VTT97027.1 serine threonine protein partial : Serine/threonine protein kinase domain protein OS=Rhodopirellula sp. SWK7 GN=RRSWK_02781 PE=4 SV=1: Pkinase: NPCBM [Gemmataceae bacterium]
MSNPTPTSSGAAPQQYPFLQPPVEPDEIGRVGHYRVLHLLGAGGMGMVFAAEDLALRRPVAIKVMHPDLAAGDGGALQRFLREARALAGVKHQNIVTVYQAFQDRGTVFLVMEFLTGESLEAWVKHTKSPVLDDVLRISREAAEGLAALHAHGLIHRDIKPANIWLESRPGNRPKSAAGYQVKILDLGLVRAADESHGLTESGMVMGTPAYMSLEQVRGQALDHRTDLFSLGCVMYALCTGRPPFKAENPVAQAAALIRGRFTPVRELNPAVPEPLAVLISRMLSTEPEDRPASAAEVIDALDDLNDLEITPVVGIEGAAPLPATEPLRAPVPRVRGANTPQSERMARKSQTGAAVPADARTEEDAAIRSGRKSRSRTKARKKPKSFWKRHGLTVVAAAWLVVAGLLVVAALGNRDRDRAGTGTQKADPTPSPAVTPGKSGEVTYLTDFPVTRVLDGPPSPFPPGFDGTVRVNGRVSAHGMLLHPGPVGRPPVRKGFRLNKEYAKFHAEVALNETAPGDAAPGRFTVYLDGVRKWQSSPVRSGAPPQACEVNLKDVTELTLEVTADGAEHGVHTVWLDPRVTK